MTELPTHQALYQVMPPPFAKRLLSALEYWSTQGDFDFPADCLNAKFPEIRPRKMRDVLQAKFLAK